MPARVASRTPASARNSAGLSATSRSSPPGSRRSIPSSVASSPLPPAAASATRRRNSSGSTPLQRHAGPRQNAGQADRVGMQHVQVATDGGGVGQRGHRDPGGPVEWRVVRPQRHVGAGPQVRERGEQQVRQRPRVRRADRGRHHLTQPQHRHRRPALAGPGQQPFGHPLRPAVAGLRRPYPLGVDVLGQRCLVQRGLTVEHAKGGDVVQRDRPAVLGEPEQLGGAESRWRRGGCGSRRGSSPARRRAAPRRPRPRAPPSGRRSGRAGAGPARRPRRPAGGPSPAARARARTAPGPPGAGPARPRPPGSGRPPARRCGPAARTPAAPRRTRSRR